MPELPLPLCSVVIPCFNKASTVARAIASVKSQTLNNIEVVVVDDGSTDNSKEMILEAIKDDARFRYVYQGNAHVAAARNRGVFQETTAPFVCCLDADDTIETTFLEVCVNALRLDPSLGIAYSKLLAIHPDGKSVVSAWPGKYDFDATLRKRNQVPTCNVSRREAWIRSGGQRDRYCRDGCGSEDAALWLEMGLLGYGGILATAEPFFHYYLGGQVSGSADYKEVAWLNKGYIATNELPFAATSTPANHQAHLVRQYDEPLISVIIPVGPGHINTVIDAIDSVEGQTFRKWELIVVDDSHAALGDDGQWQRLKDAFPFVHFYDTRSTKGAGAARNLGAEMSKAPLLLFLDADDWLTPTALADMLRAQEDNPEAIIYADYIGHAYIDDPITLDRLASAKRLIDYNQKSKEATVLYYAFDFDCDLAQRQPVVGKDPYIWNVVSSLVPAAYHREIGGFDESMASWEDWDYWVRLAKAGKCFHHLNKPLMEYRFYTGQRRSLANPHESGESGRQLSAHLLEYMQSKYERIENMPCSSCGGGRRRASILPQVSMTVMNMNEGAMSNVSSSDMVEVELVDGNLGDHLIAFQGKSYGYKSHGDKFPMLAGHARLDRRVRLVQGNQVVAHSSPAPLPPPPSPLVLQSPAPDDLTITVGGFDLTTLWGIDENRAITLKSMGVLTPGGLSLMEPDKIAKLFGVPAVTAKRIIGEAQKATESK